MTFEFSGYIPQAIASAATIIGAILVRYLMIKIIHKSARISESLNPMIMQIQRITTITINLIALTLLITIWGVEKQNVLLGLSSVFAVIGVALFAQWSILSNVTAGIIIFFNSPFRIGDYIRIMDSEFPLEAKVENFLTFYTHLRTDDDVLHIFPNSYLLQRGITVIGPIRKKVEEKLEETRIEEIK